MLITDQATTKIATPIRSPITSSTYPQIGWSMIAPWNAPVIHEYCRSVMCSVSCSLTCATESVLRVR